MSLSLPTQNGRRRALDAAINLVPFIDLLSCCIAFLLITAVWSQSAQISARTRGGSDGEGTAARPWTLLVAGDGCTLTSPSGEQEIVAAEKLPSVLGKVGEELTVMAGEKLPYDLWIRALDAAKAAGVLYLDVAFES
jgi:biopolymer transport protein ExbD